jgi:type I restriction enzyme, S subunit
MAAVSEETGQVDLAKTRRYGDARKGLRPFKDGDVLFAKITPSMENGKSAVARGLVGGHGIGSTEFHVLRPSELVLADFIRYYISRRAFRNEARRHMTGTAGQLRVPAAYLANIEIPLPPLAQQAQIIARLEGQLSLVEAAASTIRAARQKLSRYRYRLLQSLLSGHSEWPEKRIGDVATVHIGATPSRQKAEYWGGRIPWVSSGEVRFSRIGKTRETITDEGRKGSSVELHPPGTVLLAMIGEGKTRGQAAILEIEAATNQNTAAIRVHDGQVLPEWLFYSLMGGYARNRRLGSGNNQPALNKQRVADIRLAVPPRDTQSRVIPQLERALSLIDSLESATAYAEARAASLRESLLASAFRAIDSAGPSA